MTARPAVVRLLDGYVGAYLWPRDGKTYQVQEVASGSGFFLNPAGYIATNAHVTARTQAGEAAGKEVLFRQFVVQLARAKGDDPELVLKDPAVMDYIRREAKLVKFAAVHEVITADGSRFPFEIKSFGEAKPGVGKDVSVVKIEIANAPSLLIGDDSRTRLLDPVLVVGYPAAAETASLDDRSSLVASITDGTVSAQKTGVNGAPILQISAPATHGNSGGPVLNDRGEVVGLLTFGGNSVNGQEIGGFTFVVTARTVMEFVRQAGAVNEQGAVNRLYREALDAYWAGKYAVAINRFEEVERLFPQHAETRQLIAASQGAIVEARGLGQPVGTPIKARPTVVASAKRGKAPARNLNR